jgi:hypothetical protein
VGINLRGTTGFSLSTTNGAESKEDDRRTPNVLLLLLLLLDTNDDDENAQADRSMENFPLKQLIIMATATRKALMSSHQNTYVVSWNAID